MSKARAAVALTIALAVATLSVGCVEQISGTARAEPPPRVFPDLAQFNDVEIQPFHTATRGGLVYRFSTTVGVQCRLTFGAMSCGGRFSAEPYSASDNPCASVGAIRADGSSPGVYRIERSDGTCKTTAPRDYPGLEAGRKIVIGWQPDNPEKFTCAVGPPERIACIDLKNHGYVIEPTGAWTFWRSTVPDSTG